MNSKQSERGNVIELVIIGVLVIAVIGLLVWRFVDSNKTANTTNPVDTTTVQTPQTFEQSTAQSTSTTPSTTQQANSNEGYIVIDDWGVRFKPVDATKYTYSKLNSTDYGFSTATLEALGKYCTASEGKVNLVRHTSLTAPQGDAAYGQPLNNSVAINGYYYFYLGPQSAGCSDTVPTSKDITTETGQVSLIKSLIFTIEAKQ